VAPVLNASQNRASTVIAELGTRVDPGFLDENLDHHGGIVFLTICVGDRDRVDLDSATE
jgi:hypothetical protein